MTTATTIQEVKKVRATNVTFKNATWLYGTDRKNLNRNLNDKGLDFPISNIIYDTEKYIFSFISGSPYSVTLKLNLITRYLDSNGVTTYVYDDPKTGIAIMYQTRPDQHNFAIIYSNLATLANDAFGTWNFNKGAFNNVPSEFDLKLCHRSVQDKINSVLAARKAPPIVTITKGLFKYPESFKYNEFLRNQQSGAAKLGSAKANRKILKYWQANAPESTFSIYTTGSVLNPIKLAHHERHKILSASTNRFIELDFFVLKSVNQNYYTLFCPNSYLVTEKQYYKNEEQGKFHGIYLEFKKGCSKDSVNIMIKKLIRSHQEYVDNPTRSI